MKKTRNHILTWKSIPLLVLFFFCLQGGFAQTDPQVADFPSSEEALETAKQTVKAYETGNWDLLREKVTPGAVFYNLGSYDSLDLEQTINYWKKGREMATPVLAEDGSWLAVTVPEGPRRGNWILHWGNNSLSYPNGEVISFPYHVALKFEEGKVEAAHFYYDNNRIIRGMGYEIQPPLSDEKMSSDEVEDAGNG